MSVKKVKVSNFKSIEKLEVGLGQFNVLIGANASGKSNFVSVFRFLRNIQTLGLDDAISLQGGIKYLRNLMIGSDQPVSIEVTIAKNFRDILGSKSAKELIGFRSSESTYRFALNTNRSGSNFAIVDDQFSQKADFYLLRTDRKGSVAREEKIGAGEVFHSISSGKLRTVAKASSGEVGIAPKQFANIWGSTRFPSKTLLFQTPIATIPLGRLFAVFDFDPKHLQRASPITGKADLEEDGGNLPIILQKILESGARKRQFSNFLESLLPFVEAVTIDKFADKSLMFKVRERYFKNRFLPASLLSDGTINVTALIAALYFSHHEMTVIEEPERNIHPHLISKVVNLMKDAARKKQILVTTQNPEVVRQAGLESLLCVTRDRNGYSRITRPAEKDEVKTFLKNEIGIEELYVQNMLECGK